MKQTLIELIDSRCKELGITKQQMLDSADLDWYVLTNIRKGKGIRQETKQKLAKGLQCSIGDINEALANTPHPLREEALKPEGVHPIEKKVPVKENVVEPEPVEEPETEVDMTFAERLRKFREKAGYSQKALSEKIDLTPNAYNKIETRGTQPGPELLLKIAYALGCSVNDLVGYEEPHTEAAIQEVDMMFPVEEPAEEPAEEPEETLEEFKARMKDICLYEFSVCGNLEEAKILIAEAMLKELLGA